MTNGGLVFNEPAGTFTQGTNFSGSPISGNGSLVQLGPGVVSISSSNALNTYTGGTTVSGGTLLVNPNNSLNSATQSWIGTGAVTINGPGVVGVGLNGFSYTLADIPAIVIKNGGVLDNIGGPATTPISAPCRSPAAR